MFEDYMHKNETEKVLVLGSGNFGTCLADHLATLDHEVTMWCRSRNVADEINSTHKHPKYLKGYDLSPKLKATSTLSQEVFDSNGVILFAVPTQVMRDVLSRNAKWITPEHTLLFVNKGIEISTTMLPSEVIVDVLGTRGKDAVFLSGPSFAVEVVTRQITTVCVASENHKESIRCQSMFHAPFFRVYVSNDPIGVEVSGAIKNIMAIGAGLCDGLGMQANARAALITRGLAEITRIGVSMGADPTTFLGLAGVGDLLLTCSSSKSRNYTVGFRLGKGEELDHILETLGSVAEGVDSTKAAKALCVRLNVHSPMVDAAYAILYDKKPVMDVVYRLLNASAGVELDFERHRDSSSTK